MDVTLGNTREKLYLGGDAYSAPMVYVRDRNSDWVLYDIVRDYQGSITHLVDDSDGTVVAEYSYDPWGRLRDPETLEIYTPGSSTMPELMLGRGYTAHEHLDWFGLINMNARLYDPALGRFLSPDPYVQAPDFSQNFNRYSYCLNNPLKYTDPTGELFGLDDFLIAAAVGAIICAYSGGVLANNGEYNPIKWDWQSSRTYGYMFMGGLVGGVSGYMGGVIAAADIPMANTLAIASASYINSMGTYIYTGGKTPVTISFGFCSYDFTNNSWGYLGKQGNSFLANMGYSFGALANMSDLFALFIGDGRQIDINSASINKEDWWGHTSLSTRKNIEVNGNKSEIVETLVSVGPSSPINKTDNLIESLKNSFNIPADTSWSTYFGDKGTWTVTLNNVSAKALSNYSARVTTWDILFNSCVGHSTRALWSAGVPVLYLFHPMALNAQLLVRQFGIYSSPYLYSL